MQPLQRGRFVPRNTENLLRGGVLHKTGGVMSVIEGARGKNYLIDRNRRQVRLDPKIIAKIPTTKREAFLRKRELLRQSNPKSNPELAKINDAMTGLELFRQQNEGSMHAKSFRAGGGEVIGGLEQQKQMFNLLKGAEEMAPQVKAATKLLSELIAIPQSAQDADIIRQGRGIDRKVFVTRIAGDRNVATYKTKDGEIHHFTLTVDGLRQLGKKRVKAIDEALGVLRAKKEGIEAKNVRATRELELLRKIGNTRTLTPNQIAELYKFYEAQR